MWAVVRHENNRFGLFKLPQADGRRVFRALSPGRSASPRGLLLHIKGSPASARIGSAPSTKTAGLEQNKDDISGFLPDGGTRAVGDDKTKPGAPPSHHQTQTI